MSGPGFRDSFLRQMATITVVGYAPFAPGTFGTLAAALLVFLLRPGMPVLATAAVFFSITGVFAAGKAEETLGRDSSRIIIDEFAGYLISVLFLPLSTGFIVAAFALFRLLDILKPPPIRFCERLPGGMGVMADDIAAGIIANLILQGWRFLFVR
ncbi:MAG: phosphatidylglycerophosphatase A [Nitrospiraceae bacterium]|nr:phosphatidylglycerophosphatase A [Nitrospiraceae bacterium]